MLVEESACAKTLRGETARHCQGKSRSVQVRGPGWSDDQSCGPSTRLRQEIRLQELWAWAGGKGGSDTEWSSSAIRIPKVEPGTGVPHWVAALHSLHPLHHTFFPTPAPRWGQGPSVLGPSAVINMEPVSEWTLLAQVLGEGRAQITSSISPRKPGSREFTTSLLAHNWERRNADLSALNLEPGSLPHTGPISRTGMQGGSWSHGQRLRALFPEELLASLDWAVWWGWMEGT